MAAKRTTADRQRSAAIRAWAEDRGLKVAAQGRIPEAVALAYDQAQADPQEQDAGPPPDWESAAERLGVTIVSGLDLDDPPPGGWPGEGQAVIMEPGGAGNGQAPESGPPPPASLQDARETLAPPPAGAVLPPWAGARGGRSDVGQRPPPAPGPPKLTAAQRGEVQGNWALLLSLPATGLAMIDPVCGGALADNIDTIIQKSTPLVLQSPSAVKFLSEAGQWMLWYGLGAALMPVAKVVVSHHVTHTLMVLDGQVVPSRRLPSGEVVPVIEQPQVAPQDWTGYGTEVPGHVPPVRPV